jgi:TPR repeat protein
MFAAAAVAALAAMGPAANPAAAQVTDRCGFLYANRANIPPPAYLLPLAQAGDANAQLCLGLMLATGRGVPQNYFAAGGWYRRAAEQGHPVAQYLLGLSYDKGEGVPQNEILAFKWLNLAVAGAPPRDRSFWVQLRDSVALKLSHRELAVAQGLALQWTPVRER